VRASVPNPIYGDGDQSVERRPLLRMFNCQFEQRFGFIQITAGQSAAMAGIARENVNRILNDRKSRKLVSRLSEYYCIENKAHLPIEAHL
jgi:CRP-like cAMP-binding protein